VAVEYWYPFVPNQLPQLLLPMEPVRRNLQ
jgi:hypothetical protein